MESTTSDVRLTPEGVFFQIEVREEWHACLITKQTLDCFAAKVAIDTSDADEIEVFRAFETTIARTARSLIMTGACESPCVLTATLFGLH